MSFQKLGNGTFRVSGARVSPTTGRYITKKGPLMSDRIERAAELLRQRVQAATPGEFAYHDWPTSNESEVTVDGRPIAYHDEDLVIFGTPDARLIVLAVNLLKSGAIDGVLATLCRTCGHEHSEHCGPHDGNCMAPGRVTLCRCERFHPGVDAERIADVILGSES